ncbi:MAG: hypothetical protein JRN12_07255 [Nitrososphaerota archaeon]|jgi:hypothetical protein|nr:hypothetical protein [Nitrososphaerota archaeon]
MAAVRNSKGMVLRVPKAVLVARGFHPIDSGGRELVELLVRRCHAGTAESVFATYYPNDRRAEVYLGRLEAGESDPLEIIEATGYSLSDLAADFNGLKPLQLANVMLGCEGESVWVEVDGRRLFLSEPVMNTFGSMVNLRGKLGKDGPEIKFEYDGRSAVARFKGHALIEFMQFQGDELEIRYAQSKDEKHFYRMRLTSA